MAARVALPRPVLIGAAGGIALLASWAGASTWYILNEDVIAAQFFARQSALQSGYEQRIGALRAEVERVTSQKLLEQNGIAGRLAELAKKQAQLEARQAILSRLADESGPVTTGSIDQSPISAAQSAGSGEAVTSAAVSEAMAYAAAPAKPTPVSEFDDLRMRDSFGTPPLTSALPGIRPERRSSLELGAYFETLTRSVGQVERGQLRSAYTLLRRAERRTSYFRSVLAETGIDPNRLFPAAKDGMGGPLVPVGMLATGVEPVFAQAESSVLVLAQIRRVSARLPLGRPTAGVADLTSGFGFRLDPFTRGPAMHTGVDFRAEHGAAVNATARGRVISAEYGSGYGNMVEIDHGYGVTTRYAHLAEIAVSAGEEVVTGARLGWVGSTGRSTGPHLHYETRVDGVPVDPHRFLRAGTRLARLKASEAVD